MEVKKLLKVADVRKRMDAHYRDEISYSKAVELLNEDVNKALNIANVSHRSFPEKKLHLSQANGSRILEIRGRKIKDREVIINCTEHWEADDPNFGSDEHHDAAFFVKADNIDKIIETLEQAKVFLNGG